MPPLARPILSKLAERGVKDGSSQTATLGLAEVTCRRKFTCAWTESADAAKHFLGYARIDRDAGGEPVRLRRLLPAPHPDDAALVATALTVTANYQWLAARGANAAAPGSRTNRLADQSVGSSYKKLDFEVQYERPMYDLREDADTSINEEYKRYVDFLEPRPATEVQTLPGHTLSYVLAPGQAAPAVFTSGSPPATAASLPIPGTVPLIQTLRDIPVVWKRLPADFYSFFDPGPAVRRLTGDPAASPPVRPYVGTVNKTAFGPYPAGSLLVHDWKPVRRPAPFVQYAPVEGGGYRWVSPAVEWDVEYTFRYRPSLHNFVFLNDLRASGSSAPLRAGYYYASRSKTYYAPGSVPDGDSLFCEREFRDLFKVQA